MAYARFSLCHVRLRFTALPVSFFAAPSSPVLISPCLSIFTLHTTRRLSLSLSKPLPFHAHFMHSSPIPSIIFIMLPRHAPASCRMPAAGRRCSCLTLRARRLLRARCIYSLFSRCRLPVIKRYFADTITPPRSALTLKAAAADIRRFSRYATLRL